MFAVFLLLLGGIVRGQITDSDPVECEVCRLFADEFLERYRETNSTEVIPTDILNDPPLCSRMLQYRIHKEHPVGRRFQKYISETEKSLRELNARGVKLEMDVPLELWDKPSVECIDLQNRFEDEIESWFRQDTKEHDFYTFFCTNMVLKGQPNACAHNHRATNNDEL